MKLNIILLLFILCSGVLFSQEAGFIPPSPQSFSFVKATGVVSENEHTGSANANIPLFNYKVNKLSTDISLLYSGAGVKVDDLPNDTGMTWILDAGGVITRTVNGLIDEEATMRMNKNEAELIQKTVSDCAADEEIRTACYTPFQIDTERDIFDFRFSGVSGSFYFDANFVPVFLKNDSDVKIRVLLPSGETNNRKFNGFEIITKEGVKYVFGGDSGHLETTASKAMPANPPGDYAVSSFFLKEIEYMSGEKIFFNYEDIGFVTNKISEIHSRYLYQYGLSSGELPSVDPELKVSTQTHYTKNKKRLQSITNNQNFDQIAFIYTEKEYSDFNKYLSGIEYKINNNLFKKISLDYLFPTANQWETMQRFFLTGIEFYSSNVFEKKYQFNYNDPLLLPRRLTYSQDMYGYSNGKTGNGSLIAGFFGNDLPITTDYQPGILNSFGNRSPDFFYASKGTLTEVIYPTGGKTKFEYEAPKTKAIFNTKFGFNDDYNDDITIIPVFGSTYTKVIENLHFDQGISYTFTTYSGPQNPNHMNQAIFIIEDMDTHQQVHYYSKTYAYSTDSINGSFYLQKNKRYLVSFTPNGGAEIDFSYSHRDPFNGFGVRLKSISHTENGQVSEYKKFYYQPIEFYTKNEDDVLGREIIIQPSIENATFLELHNNISIPVSYAVHTSSNSNNLYNSRLQDRYSFVTTSLGGDHFENGGYQKTFRKDSDDPLQRKLPASAPGDLAGSPSAGLGYFDYINGVPNFFGILFNKAYFPAKGNRLSYSGTLNSIKYFIRKNGQIFKNKEVKYKNKYNVINSNANLFTARIFDDRSTGVCPTGSVQRIANFYISIYKNYTIDTRLEKETVTDYIDEVPLTLYNNYDDYYLAVDGLGSSESAYRKLITTTDYTYGNSLHNQVTKQITTSPDNSVTETSYQYAHEKNNQKLISANMIGIPLETVVVEKQNAADAGKLVSKSEVIYPDQSTYPTPEAGNLLLPLSVKTYDMLSPSSFTEVKYNKYDEKGNLVQYATKEGKVVTIIWGYNKTLPIAKIEGVDYVTISDAYLDADIITASNQDANPVLYNLTAEATEQNLISKLDLFRSHEVLSRYLITTYSYDPLVGVRSITPPSGIREVYKYDSANRLERIENVEGKVLKTYQYHYKN